MPAINFHPPPLPASYVDDPYLVGGKKFDLRIYALVTSYSPLRVYLYRRGRCRGRTRPQPRTQCLLHTPRAACASRARAPWQATPPKHSPCARRSGFARFTNARFSMRKEDISNTFVHLTNVAVQKHAPGFDRARGMKWPIRSLRLFMQTAHGARSRGACIHSYVACRAAAALAQASQAFIIS